MTLEDRVYNTLKLFSWFLFLFTKTGYKGEKRVDTYHVIVGI